MYASDRYVSRALKKVRSKISNKDIYMKKVKKRLTIPLTHISFLTLRSFMKYYMFYIEGPISKNFLWRQP